MCRIAGLAAKDLQEAELKKIVGAMCSTLKHGGPDDEGIYYNEEARLAFGHRRLSIIDLSANGHQPMTDIGNKAWITFNGEIYNYLELKEQLLVAGARFNSNTDTEVILAGYLHWGTAVFEKLRGMFAFALYDTSRSLTYLVRDSNGIKPLYYFAGNRRLSFASEIKALKNAGLGIEEDRSWQIRFLALGHIPEPYTTLRNVYSLPKGHVLRWDHSDDTFTIKRYVEEDNTKPVINDYETAKSLIGETLRAAVKRQLISDAPIGVFLSGGVDSSIISLLANQERQQLKTISIYFNEKEYDERAFQNIVSGKINGEKLSHLVTQDDFEKLFPEIIDDMDMPTTDGINTWFISRYARQDGLKAVLSGVGADELYGGYPSFGRIKYLKFLRMLPSAMFSAANYFKTDKYKKVSFLAHSNPLADYLFLRGFFTPEDIAKILDTDLAQIDDTLFNDIMAAAPSEYDERHAAWFETNFYMQNQLLRDTDVMSMSHGLEVRIPFLDESFRELAHQVAPHLRFSSKQPKKILIDSFHDLLPASIWNRPKMGFTFPLQQWMRSYSDISEQNLYNGKWAQGVVKKFKNNQVHWSKIFALYQLQIHD
ncbi:MAG TPA: asparagine synthase (glutamine-hydrolyzing) [Mucilaginibacter sp.]